MIFDNNKIDKILNKIFPLPKNFGVFFDDNYTNCTFEEYDILKNLIKEVDKDASICFGASKMVIISPNLDNVVIKIPFNGYYIKKDFKNEIEWHPFCWAPGSSDSDYCLAEYEKYNKLKTYGLDCFVAKTIFYKKINNVNIFLQEKIIPKNNIYKKIYNPSKKSQDLANKWYQEGEISDTKWIANCLDKYGESKVKRFLYYCKNIDLDILEDMYESNYGYRINGTPVILDYSNYCD